MNIERKKDGSSKGSCFVRFATENGVQQAVAYSGVEMMGRQVWIEKTKAKSERMKIKDGARKRDHRGLRYNRPGSEGEEPEEPSLSSAGEAQRTYRSRRGQGPRDNWHARNMAGERAHWHPNEKEPEELDWFERQGAANGRDRRDNRRWDWRRGRGQYGGYPHQELEDDLEEEVVGYGFYDHYGNYHSSQEDFGNFGDEECFREEDLYSDFRRMKRNDFQDRERFGRRGSFHERKAKRWGGSYHANGSNFGSSQGSSSLDQSKIIFVGNLNYRSEKDDIWEFFQHCGNIVDIRIAHNPSGSVSIFPLQIFPLRFFPLQIFPLRFFPLQIFRRKDFAT